MIKNEEGKITHFTPGEFRERIIDEERCFVCGADRVESDFNEEHIFPKWMLDELGMHGKSIELPYHKKHQYGTYTVPCCSSCNSESEIYR